MATHLAQNHSKLTFKSIIMHNSYNAAANFASANGGVFNYLWKNTFNSSSSHQTTTSAGSKGEKTNNNGGKNGHQIAAADKRRK